MRGTAVRAMVGTVALAALTLPVQAKDLAQSLRGRWAADKMYAEFVDDDTIKLSKVGDEMILVLKRTK